MADQGKAQPPPRKRKNTKREPSKLKAKSFADVDKLASAPVDKAHARKKQRKFRTDGKQQRPRVNGSEKRRRRKERAAAAAKANGTGEVTAAPAPAQGKADASPKGNESNGAWDRFVAAVRSGDASIGQGSQLKDIVKAARQQRHRRLAHAKAEREQADAEEKKQEGEEGEEGKGAAGAAAAAGGPAASAGQKRRRPPSERDAEAAKANARAISVIVVATSAKRCTNLLKSEAAKLGQRVGKLWAKHMKVADQAQQLAEGAYKVAVGTPGRLLQLVQNGALDLSKLDALVLDGVPDQREFFVWTEPQSWHAVRALVTEAWPAGSDANTLMDRAEAALPGQTPLWLLKPEA